jgi:G:T-mismatch repair DNA endonuclease (very short patch repair protein)
MSSSHPEFVSVWHPTLNKTLTPHSVSAGSSKKVWWLCDKKHEWEATIANITRRKSGCPYCSGRKVLVGGNDLATTNPMIAKKWHPTKNGSLTAQEVSVGSSKKVWWKCEEGHEWNAHINIQTDTSCPYCYGRYVIPGENDLATLYPTSVKEWHPTKNGNRIPQNTMPYTPKKIWWICQKEHEWEVSPNSRFAKGDYTGCPYCTNKKVLLGFNDLITAHPQIAKTWHPTKNGNITPDKITSGSETLFWWKCLEGHEWQAGVYSRAVMGTGCAACSGKKVNPGVTDLQTLNPLLAAQWHPTKNGDLTPDQVAAFSSRKVWWKCGKNHVWEAAVANRYQGRNCAKCTSGEKASNAEKELALYVESLGLEIVRHGRTILKGQEIDIYVPSKKIAIEYNGIYWHTEKHGNKGRNYHRDKWLACKDQGIQLIQIWEDEWNRNPAQVKRMLAHKLGFSAEKKVFARKTTVSEITKQEAEAFLNDNHIQGYASGSYYLGLKDKSDESLISVLVLNKEAGTDGKTLNIIRYATSANVVGGFTKLLSYSDKTYKPISYVTFADHCVSDGGLYENNGFVIDRELPPDYMYFFNKQRHHKFGYRLKRFRDDPTLIWEEGLTERQLADLNELDRVWDAGKTRYVRYVQ